MLPLKKPKQRMGVKEPRPEFPQHKAWVRGHTCCVPGCCEGPIEAAHVQDDDRVPYEDRGWMQGRPHDKWTYSLCTLHHRESHTIGHDRFDRKYGIDRFLLALEFQRQSPHRHRWIEQEAAA